MAENKLPGLAGAAGFCQNCPKPTAAHDVAAGSFCAKHYAEYLECFYPDTWMIGYYRELEKDENN